MTSNKHFLNAVYTNCDLNLKNFTLVGSKACFTLKIFAVAKIFIISAPAFLKSLLLYHLIRRDNGRLANEALRQILLFLQNNRLTV